MGIKKSDFNSSGNLGRLLRRLVSGDAPWETAAGAASILVESVSPLPQGEGKEAPASRLMCPALEGLS